MSFNRTFALALGAGLAAGAVQAQEVTLTAMTGLPETSPVAQVFLQYVERVNEAGKGVVQIDYLGGPETTPIRRQPAALERGLVDIVSIPSSYFAGTVVEIDALLGVNRPMAELRENGGFDALDARFQEQANAKMLGWFDTEVHFNMYFKTMPEITDTAVSFDGLRMFTTPTYRDFQSELGATPVAVEIGELLTSLERGVLDGYGWPDYALVAMGFGRETNYRLDPSFYSGNTPAFINLDKWNELSDEVKAVLHDQAIAWETEAPAYINGIKEEELATLKEGGMEVIELPEAVATEYLNLAYKVVWDRLAASGSPVADELREKFYDPSLN